MCIYGDNKTDDTTDVAALSGRLCIFGGVLTQGGGEYALPWAVMLWPFRPDSNTRCFTRVPIVQLRHILTRLGRVTRIDLRRDGHQFPVTTVGFVRVKR